jgi:outer membrane receptor protein involved in Fe transport
LEVPFAKGKGTALVAVRKSVDDFLLADVIQRTMFLDTSVIFGNYRFSDFNFKVSYEFSEKNRWYLSYYRGWDEYRSDLLEEFFFDGEEEILVEARDETQLTWGNHVAALRWNHIFNPRTFSNTTLTLTRYEFLNANFGYVSAVEEEFEESVDFGYYFGLGSSVFDVSLSSDFEVTAPPNHHLRFGFGATYHSFSPEQIFTELDAAENPDFDSLDIEDINESSATFDEAIELHGYFEDEFKVGQRWHFNTGLRLSAFVKDRVYLNPEPRLSARYRLNDRWQLTAAIDRTVQYLHRLNYSEINLPSDVWITSDEELRPERSWQGTLGATGTLRKGVSFSVEGFAKSFRNVRSFAFFIEDSNGEESDVIPNIDGTAYGLEFFLRKTGQRTGGWLSYTLSRADREINDLLLRQKYAFQYDRRHDLKLFLYHRLTDRIQLGLNWIYGSPQPRLLSDEETVLGEPSTLGSVPPYPFRPTERLDPYHRLDLSAAYSFRGKFLEHTLKASVYNLYDRENTAFFRVSFSNPSGAPVRMVPRLFGLFYGVKF